MGLEPILSTRSLKKTKTFPKRKSPFVPKCPLTLPHGYKFLGDTNEYLDHHLGYELDPLVKQHMDTGDYSLVAPDGRTLEAHVVVERKAFADMLGCVTTSRNRWEACLERLEEIEHPHLVIEGSMSEILKGGYTHSKVNPASVFGSIVAWTSKHRISTWFAENRIGGYTLTQWVLAKAARELVKGLRFDRTSKQWVARPPALSGQTFLRGSM
jgi:hypothetical protein